MKASKFTDAQKAFIIHQGEDGTTMAEICRKAGISRPKYHNCKKKYGGKLPTDMKRLCEPHFSRRAKHSSQRTGEASRRNLHLEVYFAVVH